MSTINTLTAALLQARESGLRADAAGLPVPSYEEALEVQKRVQANLGPVAGFKVARRPEGPPVIAPIDAAKVVESGAGVAVRDMLGIELEIGFEVIETPGADPVAEVARVFRPRIVLELVDSRLDGRDIDPLLKLADMQINDGLVLGPALTGWEGGDFGTVEARLACGDTRVVDGEVAVPGGSALANLGLLCAHVRDHCGGLQPGQVIITGSLSGLEYFPAGTDVDGRIAGFGRVSCRLT